MSKRMRMNLRREVNGEIFFRTPELDNEGVDISKLKMHRRNREI